MAYALQFNTTDTLAATLNSGATSTTLTTGNFGSPTGTQLYVVDYDVPAKAEIISASVAGTAVTSVTRGLTGGAAGTTDHAIGAKIGSIFVPQHYTRVATRTLGYAEITSNFSSTATPTVTDITGLSVAVTVPVGGARVKITGYIPYINKDTNAGDVALYIMEGATVKNKTITTYSTTASIGQTAVASFTATAGAHTYKLTFSQSTAGTYLAVCDATYPAYILVENGE